METCYKLFTDTKMVQSLISAKNVLDFEPSYCKISRVPKVIYEVGISLRKNLWRRQKNWMERRVQGYLVYYEHNLFKRK